MEEASHSGVRNSKRRNSNGPTLQDIALGFILRDGNKAVCRIDKNGQCAYAQVTFDIGNFIRHFRTKHQDLARKHCMLKEGNGKRPRIIAKRPIAIDKQLLLDSIVKLVTYHQLPLACVEWEALKQLIDPISAAVDAPVNRNSIKSMIYSAAYQIRRVLSQEMKCKLICLKIDSASRFNRHVLGINAQYCLEDKIVIRTLGNFLIYILCYPDRLYVNF